MSARTNRRSKTARKPGKAKDKRLKDWRPLSVTAREGKTTVRQFEGRRFVRFGEFRGKKVARVEFYTCGRDVHSISVRFQDRTVLYFEITPLFTVRPEYYSLKTGNVVTLKRWPEIKIER